MTIGVAENSFTSTGPGESIELNGPFDVSVDFTTGAGAGTVVIERSFDDGATWKPKAVASYTSDAEEQGDSPGVVLYRFNCTAYSSGTISTRLST